MRETWIVSFFEDYGIYRDLRSEGASASFHLRPTSEMGVIIVAARHGARLSESPPIQNVILGWGVPQKFDCQTAACCSSIQLRSAVNSYLTNFSPTRSQGGPSPRARQLRSVDRETHNSLAVSRSLVNCTGSLFDAFVCFIRGYARPR